MQHLQQVQRDASQTKAGISAITAGETDRGLIALAPSSYDISSDLQDLLKMQQQNS